MIACGVVRITMIESIALCLGSSDVVNHCSRVEEDAVVESLDPQAHVRGLPHPRDAGVVLSETTEFGKDPAAERHVAAHYVVNLDHPAGIGREIAGVGAVVLQLPDLADANCLFAILSVESPAAHCAYRGVIP